MFVLFPLSSVKAAVFIENKTFTKNETWTSKAGPYHIAGHNVIPRGITVKVEAGTKVLFENGEVLVNGTFKTVGSEHVPVGIILDEYSHGFTVRGGTLDMDFSNIQGGLKFVDAFATSSVNLTNTNVSDVSGGSSAISIFGRSSLVILDSQFKDMRTNGVIEIFQGSTGTIERTAFEFERIGQQTTNTIPNINTNTAPESNTAVISVFDISTENSAAAIDTISIKGCGRGIEVYRRALVSIKNSTFEKCSKSALLIHSDATAEIYDTAFLENTIGVEQYSASTLVRGSTFEHNTGHGAYVVGGEFDSSDNWWGSESGPHNIQINPTGTGDDIAGFNPVPWLTKLPDRGPCCSSVIFIPGFQGSRLYKKGTLIENRLWEPGISADVKKLFLNKEGNSIDSSIYTKDIILRTDAGPNAYDKDIYQPLSNMLDTVVRSGKIKEWKTMPYDWRMAPETLLANGIKTSGSLKKIQDEIQIMAKRSKTKKVSLVAHSYGGIVTKKILEDLERKNLSHIIDKVTFVAVPEQGSIEAVAALLHGDNQAIGFGLILKKHIARSMGLNSPASYFLLPSQDLLASRHDTPVISFKTSKWFSSNNSPVAPIKTLSALEDFLRASSITSSTGSYPTRPFSKKDSDTDLPAILNPTLLTKAKQSMSTITSVLNTSVASSSLSASSSRITMFNIFGNGRKTLTGITYVDKGCPLFSFFGLFDLTYCGFDHVPTYDDTGDGSVPVGDLSKRWGEKIEFNIQSYNSENRKNVAHADILTAEPVLNMIKYITTRQSTTTSAYSVRHLELITQNQINQTNQISTSIYERENFQLIATPKNIPMIYMSAKNTEQLITGTLKILKNASSSSSVIENGTPVLSQIPNSTYSEFGGSAYIMTENAPSSVTIQSPEPGTFDLTANIISGSTSIPVFFHQDIPISEESNITITQSTSSQNSQSETPQFILTIDHDGDGSPEDTIVLGDVGNNTGNGNGGGNSGTGNGSGNTNTGGGGTNQQISPEQALSKIKADMANGKISERFRQRYLIKIKSIETSIKRGKTTEALSASYKTTQSLAAILKELSKSMSRYYKGGMTKAEAALLYGWFSTLYTNLYSTFKT